METLDEKKEKLAALKWPLAEARKEMLRLEKIYLRACNRYMKFKDPYDKLDREIFEEEKKIKKISAGHSGKRKKKVVSKNLEQTAMEALSTMSEAEKKRFLQGLF